MVDRRQVLGGALALAAASERAFAQPPARPFNLLILGGTGFIGPHHVRAAVARGHRVSVFNRGRSQADLPAGVEYLIGDRNNDLTSIETREWDAVLDLPAILPAWVRLSGQALARRTKHYTYISTIAVYAPTISGLVAEDAPLRSYRGAADPFSLSSYGGGLYGPLKVISEAEVERWFPSKALIVRPGIIAGPGDNTDRFTYWPMRLKRGGEVLAPGDPNDPTQFIDVRDLADWVIRMIEAGAIGPYSANGPTTAPLGFGQMLEAVQAGVGGAAQLTWLPTDWLRQRRAQIPFWYPPPGNGVNRIDVRKAVSAGLTFRPVAATAADTLAWREGISDPVRGALPPDRERELLAAWKAGLPS